MSKHGKHGSYIELLNPEKKYDTFNLPGFNNELRLQNNKSRILIEKSGKERVGFLKICKKDFYIKNSFCERDMLTIKHEHLVSLNDIYENDIYIIFRYKYYNMIDLFACVSNNILYNIVKKNNHLDKISKQLIMVINYLHNKKICHRDIKIDNILVNFKDGFKILVCDFEFIINTDSFGYNIRIGDDNNLGTLQYMAPELYRPGNINWRQVDIWGIGIVLCIIYSQTLPGTLGIHNSHSYFKIWDKHYNDIFYKHNNLKEKDLNIIMTFMNPDPSKRKSLDKFIDYYN
jgi:serine/threonine protein kinase